MPEKPKQIQAIDLVKQLFEHIHGNLGLLRFSVEKLEPNNTIPNNQNADKWIVKFSFYKTLSSGQPTRYHADIDLTDKTVSVKEVDSEGKPSEEKKYKITEETKEIAEGTPETIEIPETSSETSEEESSQQTEEPKQEGEESEEPE